MRKLPLADLQKTPLNLEVPPPNWGLDPPPPQVFIPRKVWRVCGTLFSIGSLALSHLFDFHCYFKLEYGACNFASEVENALEAWDVDWSTGWCGSGWSDPAGCWWSTGVRIGRNGYWNYYWCLD